MTISALSNISFIISSMPASLPPITLPALLAMSKNSVGGSISPPPPPSVFETASFASCCSPVVAVQWSILSRALSSFCLVCSFSARAVSSLALHVVECSRLGPTPVCVRSHAGHPIVNPCSFKSSSVSLAFLGTKALPNGSVSGLFLGISANLTLGFVVFAPWHTYS